MTWTYDKSLDRIKKHRDGIGEIEVIKLVREADLNGLLSETCCREIYGAHVYVTISNFAHLASDTIYAEDDYKRLIQGIHIYQREVSRIIEDSEIFNGLRVHFQGPKLHALFYRPIDDGEKLATNAVLLQLVLKDFVKSVFNPSFPHYDNFEIAGGADLGNSVGTRNGARNDRELLFLGACANYPAKIIKSSGQLRISKNIYDALPSDIQELCDDSGDEIYQIGSVKQTDLDALLEKYKIKWNREKSDDRIKEDKESFPLKDIAYSSADTKINFDDLSVYKNKRVLAASIFGDISGFTPYIDSADTDEKKKVALKVLHVIRKEMASVLKDDFDGIRVQYQGDRAQGLFHLPKDEESDIATIAVEAAVGLQSSMEHTIKEAMPEASELKLAVGVDIDTTLASKLGTRAHRDRICLGEAVEGAAITEEKCAGGQIGISERIYEAIPERLSKHFSYDKDAKCYVAKGITAETIERAAKAAAYLSGAPVFIKSESSGVTVSDRESENARSVVPARSFAVE